MHRRSSNHTWPSLAVPMFIFTALTLSAHAAPEAAQKAFLWRPFLAPFHAVVLHFPIGFLTMVCVSVATTTAMPVQRCDSTSRTS